MNGIKSFVYVILTGLLALVISSCSGSSKSPLSPIDTYIHDNPLPGDIDSTSEVNRDVLSVYDAVIDPVSQTFAVTPIDRSSQYHLPLTQLYPNTLTIIDYGFTPHFWADIRLKHPLPGSGIDAFDPRVIAILPANAGVKFTYPVFNCVGNNRVLRDPDGYTKLFDDLGGSILGNTNPFKAYFKDEPYRRWSSTIATQEIQRWDMDLNGFGGPMQFKLVVDLSANYPNPPTPIVDNAPEPVSMKVTVGNGLSVDGGSTKVEVTFFDWQGSDEIKCKVESPDLFSGSTQLFYSGPGQNEHEYIFSGTISNDLLAQAGDHEVLLAAWDIPTGTHIFWLFNAYASGIPDNPVEVTPPWLNFTPCDIQVQGNYAYVPGSENGFQIFNISDPLNPIWINNVNPPGGRGTLRVVGDYVYVAGDKELAIVDINPPETAHTVNTASTSEYYISGISISDGYAYVSESSTHNTYCFEIIDIDPPESAHVVNTIETPYDNLGVYVSGGYAYVLGDNFDYSIQIIDISPPESAHVVNNVFMLGTPAEIVVSGDYAYIVNSLGLHIMDINPPESAYIVNSIDLPPEGLGVDISGGYAYVADAFSGLQIVDIDPVESAHLVKTVETHGLAYAVDISGNYAYIANPYLGIQMADITYPQSAYLMNTIDTSGNVHGVYISGDYAFSTGSGLKIFDIEEPELAKIIKTLYIPDLAVDIYVSDGYAYVCVAESGFHIVDVDPLESAYIVKTVDTPSSAIGVFVSGSYAYVADKTSIQIIDIDPPESAYIVKGVATNGTTYRVQVSEGYAFATVYETGLKIIDIDPPESSHIVKIVNTSPNVSDVYVSGDYAYVTDSTGLEIININPPESAYIVKTVNILYASQLYVSDGYAYVGTNGQEFKIIDINPPESAYISGSINSIFGASDVRVADGYVYIASQGLRIFKLW
jgi:hypothetical protein